MDRYDSFGQYSSNESQQHSSANLQQYTVGWICSLRMDLVIASSFLDEEHSGPSRSVKPGDNNIYVLGRIGDHGVVIAALPEGKNGAVEAAVIAQNMLRSFPDIRIGLSVGIGGGAPSLEHDVRLGDVVVGRPGDGDGGVLQYDFGKAIQGQPWHPTGYLNSPPKVLLAAARNLEARYAVEGHQLASAVEAAVQKLNRTGRNRYARPAPTHDRLYQYDCVHPPEAESCEGVCDTALLVVRRERDEGNNVPSIHYGLIASGNQLMKDALVRDQLAREKGVLCFEMEAAGLMNHFPCIVIRGICNYADSHMNRNWQGYAAMVAAAYAKDLLQQISPVDIGVEEPTEAVPQNIDQVQRILDPQAGTVVPDDEELSSDGSTTSSVFSHASLASSLGGYEALHLPEQLATFLLGDQELRSFYQRAASLFGIESFSQKHNLLLKRYVADLKVQKQTGLYRQAIRLLGGVRKRGEVTDWVVQSVTATEHSLDKLKQQSAAGNRKIVEQYPQLLGTQVSETRPAPQVPQHEIDSEDSGAAEDPDFQDENDEEPVRPVFESLVEGAAFEAFKARMSCLVNPPSDIAEALTSQSPDLLTALLEQRFAEVATDEYAWIGDLRDAGLRRREIAEILYSSAHDKPWIFHAPDSDLLDKWETTSTQFHAEGCSHSLQSQTSKDTAPASIEESVKSSPQLHPTELQRHIEEFCGLGGIAPNTRDLEAWNGRVQFEQNCAAVVSHTLDHPDQPGLDNLLYIARRLHRMSRSLLAAMALLQQSRLCCDSFTVLKLVEEQPGHHQHLQLCNIPFYWATVFEHCCQKTAESLAGYDYEKSTPDCMLLGAWSANLLSSLHLSEVIPTSDESALSPKAHLHVASMAMQLLCVGLLSYKQAHIGSLQPFFLDCRIEETALLGLQSTLHTPEDRRLHIRSHVVNLSCLGEMTQDKVMVFSLSNQSAKFDNARRFDVCGAPQDILDTWGPGQIVCRQDGQNTLVAMVLAGGFVGPVRSDDGAVTYHFSHQLDIPPDAPDMDMKDAITVGTFIKVNRDCCNQVQANTCWERTADRLDQLDTSYSYWETVEKQVGVQAGHQFIGQVNLTKVKRPGISIKQARLQQQPINNPDLVEFLGYRWGVRVSQCTGVAQRVLLRHLAGELLPVFAEGENISDDIFERWKTLRDKHKALENLQNENGTDSLRSWLRTLPDDLSDLLLGMTRRLLLKLANTGLSSDRRFFSIAWMSPSDRSTCIRISLEHGHANMKWLQMLEDSVDCATFAYMSDVCLEAGEVACQGAGWQWKDQIPMLETAVHCPDHLQPSQWTLTHGKVYFFRHLNRDQFWVKAEMRAWNMSFPVTRLTRSNNIPQHVVKWVDEHIRKKNGRICEKHRAINSQEAVVVSSR